ncbi:DUF2127 domain-containing protein [Bauldia sp.]|uniref:DUF2127 domain-containing protein n=1 Tax=Bauldia sp. TaxID=2575872 RepID=UPI003BA9DCC2
MVGTAVDKRDERETILRRLFRYSLFLKAAHSVLELVVGLALYFVPSATIERLAHLLVQHELLAHPDDAVAAFIVSQAESFSIDQKTTATVYLLSHGVVEIVLVIMILRNHAWAFPLFMAALAALIAYQCYQLSVVFTAWLAGLTVFDIVVLWLTWHEFRLRRALRPTG